LYERIAAACRSGRTIEIGGGIGNLKEGSSLFYRFFHHEPVLMSAHPRIEGKPQTRDPCAGNQAIPGLLVTRDRELFHHLCPELRLVRVDWFSFVAYPMSGGFKPWSLLTGKAASQMLRFERLLAVACAVNGLPNDDHDGERCGLSLRIITRVPGTALGHKS
jgi:hypothetical protein